MKRRNFFHSVAAAGLTAGMSAMPSADVPAMAVVEKKSGMVAFYSNAGNRLSEVKPAGAGPDTVVPL